MYFTKPAWVIHKDSAKGEQNAKRLSIFTVDVHPDGSRIATGGLDAKIRIWSTKPILNQEADESGKPPKSLSTLTQHTGPVLTLRWAHSGKWLASGSDDESVMIWDHNPNARGRVWGTDDINIEGWKCLKRLPGHSSDVTDVAWAPEDRYLASVGLDSKVIIWCGFSLEMLRRLDLHQGFVKGVCWDPVGEFLATQSDDRTVKIWRTTDWALEAEVTKPFEDSPGSTFFRRLSWSPDGAHITASNATNNKGYVFIAAVITRNTWTSDISLVGHENTVEVACYNPHIFLRDPKKGVSTANICSVVALGADDRSVSVWQTKSARPLIVAKDVFERQILDLSWSRDGLALYAVSSDGTLAAFKFSEAELEGIASEEDQRHYLAKFNFTPPPIPEGYSHESTQQPTATSTQLSDLATYPSPEKVNVLVAKKKRAGLTSTMSASAPPGRLTTFGGSATAPPSQSNGTASRRAQLSTAGPVASSSRTSFADSFPDPSEQPFDAPWSRFDGMDVDPPIDSLGGGKNKRKASFDSGDEPKAKGRTMGGERTVERSAPTHITQWTARKTEPSSGIQLITGSMDKLEVLSPLPLLSYLSSDVEGTADVLEGKNIETNGTTEVALISGKSAQWLDYLPSPVICLKATANFCAVGMQDGSINVYSMTGRRLMPTMMLGAPCAVIQGCKNALMVITTHGQLFSWNVKKGTSTFPPISISHLLAPNLPLLSSNVRENGVPYLTIDGTVYAYDANLQTWVKASDRWWAEGSDFWQGRQRTASAAAQRGVIASIESAIHLLDESSAERQRPEWWTSALSLGHLETRLHSAKLLDSSQEYRQAMLQYAKKISDEGFKGKAEELVKELFGPVYWKPGMREDTAGWSSTVVGLSKRDLLKDVLGVFARSRTLGGFASQWLDTLKKAANGDDSF